MQSAGFYEHGVSVAVYAATHSGPLQHDHLVFYTHTLYPYAQRVWLALLEKVLGVSG